MTMRKEMLARRDAISSEFGSDESRHLNRYIREYVLAAGAKYVAGYMPIGSEYDLRPLMSELDEYGVELALPVVKEKNAPLIFRHWRPGEVLHKGSFGIAQPHENNRLVVPELILVPLLAFDTRGFRLGYGGGYYDRTISDLKAKNYQVKTLGIAYNNQKVDRIKDDATDMPLDAVATENGIEKFLSAREHKCA